MKKPFFTLFILSCGLSSIAQPALPPLQADSLWGAWTQTDLHDTLRLEALNTFANDGYSKLKPDSAIYYLQMEYDFALNHQQPKYQVKAANLMGQISMQKSDFGNALGYFTTAKEIATTINEYRGLGSSLIGLGNVAKNTGNFYESIAYFEKALGVFRQSGNVMGQASAYNNIGITYKNLGDFPRAVEYYTASLVAREQIGDRKNAAPTLMNLGHIYKAQGDLIRAMGYYEASLEIETEFDNEQGMANNINSIGLLYKDHADYIRANEMFGKAEIIYKETGNKQGLANCILNLGVVAHEQGNFLKALDYYKESLVIMESIGDLKGTSAVLNNIGSLYNDLEDYNEAIIWYTRSFKIKEQIKDRRGIAYSYTGMAVSYYHVDSVDQAIQFCKDALQIAIETGEVSMERSAMQILQRNYIEMGEYENAAHYLFRLIHLVKGNLATNYFSMTEREKELYFTTMEKDFGRLYDFTIHHGAAFEGISDSAYNLVLQTKGLSLKSSSLIRSAIAESTDSALVATYEAWTAAKKNLADLQRKSEDITKAEADVSRLEKELIKRSGAFSDFDKIKNLDWTKIRDGLNENEAAIEFVHFKTEIDTLFPVIYAALIITKNALHPEVVKLCTGAELTHIMGNVQRSNLAFVNGMYGTLNEPATALYHLVWQPLEIHLDDVKTIYYSPSGLLHKISFAAISKAPGVVLSDLYNFRQMGSTGNLMMAAAGPFDKSGEFLLMGGINYENDKTAAQVWSYLPGSLNETESINSFLQQKKIHVNYFKDTLASEAVLKEQISGASFVHIATHGFFFPDPDKVREEMRSEEESNKELIFRGNGGTEKAGTTNYANWSFINNKNPLMRSGIVLAGANDVWQRDALADGEDGVLTAQEVSNLDLRNTQLVVLSACETGLGDIKGSEGVYGLQRAFKMAGVNYLIMSLWQVPDKETAEFMQLFYKNLLKLKNIPKAFQNTQKTMRQKYDPYYWGAFVLIE